MNDNMTINNIPQKHADMNQRNKDATTESVNKPQVNQEVNARPNMEAVERSEKTVEKQQVPTNPAMNEKMAQTVKEFVEAFDKKINRKSRFNIEADANISNNYIVRIYDPETDELRFQIPLDEVIVIAHNISEYLDEHKIGLFVDEKV